jgi:hypothetical protein
MNRRVAKYFVFLFVIFWSLFTVFVNTTALYSQEGHLQNNAILIPLDTDSATTYKQAVLDFESQNDKVEVSETEVEEEAHSLSALKKWNYFSAFLLGEFTNTFSDSFYNGLAPCKHIHYLSSIAPRYITNCVYRI